MDVPRNWGASPEETADDYPCDGFVDQPATVLFRAVGVQAEPAVVFRRLCQLKVAPYSYDLLDNLGRRSPRTLTPGVENLEIGQRVMTIFRLVDFSYDEHLTLLLDAPRARRVYGDLAVTYAVREDRPGGSRLVAKLALAPGGRVHAIRVRLLAWGDLLMMRRQLLTLRDLAGRTRPADAEPRSVPG